MTDQTPQHPILILGASYAGISTAHYLLKHVVPALSSPTNYQVVLISSSTETMCRPACPRALLSDNLLPQDKLFVDIPTSFAQYGSNQFRFVHGTVMKLDHIGRTVTLSPESGSPTERVAHDKPLSLSYHALIIATGTSTTSPLFGLNRDAQYLRNTWKDFRKALASAKTIAIAGAGPTGIEVAGELGEYLNGPPRSWYSISSIKKTPKVEITVFCAESKILPNLRASIASKAEQYLADVGVTVVKNTRVASVSPESAGRESGVASKATLTLKDGSLVDADLYIPAYGAGANTAFVDKSLLTATGTVNTNAKTLRVDAAGPRVYAVGDVGSYARSAIHLILEAVPVVCTNIKRDLMTAAAQTNGTMGNIKQSKAAVVPDEDRIYKEDTRETQLVPIGRSRGVGAAMGWSLPGWLVWAIKGRDYWIWTTGPLWNGNQWTKAS